MKERVLKLKKEKNAVILAHYYTPFDVQEVADFVGDSLELAKKAKEVDCDIIVFCGVYFMAETAKILNPDKKVLIPHSRAGCLLADMITPEELREFKKQHPEFTVVAYVNTSADVKAEADICCTSSNAVKITESVEGEFVLLVPDQNLADFVASKVKNKKVIGWKGYCPVHHRLKKEEVLNLKDREAIFVCHPECRREVRELADFVGSTSQIVKFLTTVKNKKVVLGTEEGTIFQIKKQAPSLTVIPAYKYFVCEQMKMITLERLLKSLELERYEVVVDEEISKKALVPIEKMFEVG
jgi:quinolinate synthase